MQYVAHSITSTLKITCENNSSLNSPSGRHLTHSHVRSSMKPNYFQAFCLLNCLFCLRIVNKSNYLNKIASEVAKLAITITHSNISRGRSPLGILRWVHLKSEWRLSLILLIHLPRAIPILASIANRKSIVCSIFLCHIL